MIRRFCGSNLFLVLFGLWIDVDELRLNAELGGLKSVFVDDVSKSF